MAEATKPKSYNVTLNGTARGPRGFYEAGKGRPTYLRPGESRVLVLEEAEVRNSQVRVEAGEVTITAAGKAPAADKAGADPGHVANQDLDAHTRPVTAANRAGNLGPPVADTEAEGDRAGNLAAGTRTAADEGGADLSGGVDISALQDDQLRAFVTSLQDGKEPPSNTKRETLERKATELMAAKAAKEEPGETV